jgi:hypothetical protein
VSANLDLVRSICLAWERGDFSSTDWADPEIEFVVPDGPEPVRSKGLAAMTKSARDYLGAWEDHRLLADEYRELDVERVLVVRGEPGSVARHRPTSPSTSHPMARHRHQTSFGP